LNLKGKILTLIAATIQVQDLKACEFDKTWDSFREYKGLINWDGYSYNFFGVPQTLKCWYLGHWTGGTSDFLLLFSLLFFLILLYRERWFVYVLLWTWYCEGPMLLGA
jgi:hypothetical protein